MFYLSSKSDESGDVFIFFAISGKCLFIILERGNLESMSCIPGKILENYFMIETEHKLYSTHVDWFAINIMFTQRLSSDNHNGSRKKNFFRWFWESLVFVIWNLTPITFKELEQRYWYWIKLNELVCAQDSDMKIVKHHFNDNKIVQAWVQEHAQVSIS